MKQRVVNIPLEFKTPGRGYARVLVTAGNKYAHVGLDLFPSAYNLTREGSKAFAAVAGAYTKPRKRTLTGKTYTAAKVPLAKVDDFVDAIIENLNNWIAPMATLVV
jgi:hypothetical protein